VRYNTKTDGSDPLSVTLVFLPLTSLDYRMVMRNITLVNMKITYFND
jgi:hypothetical protein